MATIHEACVQTLRFLAADEVEKAKSGHPGFPLGTAPLMYTFWDKFMRYNPADPKWFNRDRFVLSPGHGSALLYAMLHLAGYDISLDDLKSFRQWGSKTPGHPEYGVTPGVDVSTGPLGHGFAMGVGLSLAESMLAAKYNKPDFPVIDHYTYGLVSDGDLMEGVASEAASLAGTLGLGKLIYMYDDNKITIEGSTYIAFTECVETRFKAYGWQVLRVESSEDLAGKAHHFGRHLHGEVFYAGAEPQLLLEARAFRALRFYDRRGKRADAVWRKEAADSCSGHGAQDLRRRQGYRYLFTHVLGLQPVAYRELSVSRSLHGGGGVRLQAGCNRSGI